MNEVNGAEQKIDRKCYVSITIQGYFMLKVLLHNHSRTKSFEYPFSNHFFAMIFFANLIL